MTNDLTGRVAIVTGASRGLGRAIALRFAAAGASVVAGAREHHADAVVGQIRENGGNAVAVTVDLTNVNSIATLGDTALEQYGRIDVLFNYPCIVIDQLMVRMKPEDWDVVLATNLTATFESCRCVLRTMVKQRSGRIINISSVVGQSGNPGQANYAASKAGMVGLSKSLAREVASRGITVNVVAPGLIDTDMTSSLPEAGRPAMLGQIPMGRLGTPEEIASAVHFLASDEASYITGQVVAVNGGMYM